MFPTKPPPFIDVDIVEQCRVPILFSLQHMTNLHIKLDMRPDGVLIRCEALGLHHVQAAQSSSSHIVIDIAALLPVPARMPSNCENVVVSVFLRW